MVSEVTGTGRTKGREATNGVIPGRFALSVGMPTLPTPDDWHWTPLSEVARLESGHTPSRKIDTYWNGDIPWIGIKDAVDNHGRTINDTYQKVSQLGLENSSARLLPAGTVCLSRTASVGYVVIMGTPMATSQDFVNWCCGPAISPEYLKYILFGENEALWRFASGTTHQTIYYPEAKAFHALLPPIHEQRAIARILGALDDKIELNRQMNETLEALARALFQSWFVDFDPVRAKMRGEQPVGMDAATAALFPSRLVQTEHGEVPEGWTTREIGQAVTVVGGSTPSTERADFWDGPHAWVRPKDLSNLSTPVLLNTERTITDAGLATISSKLLPINSVLLSSRAPIGYLAINRMPVAINQGFIGMVCDGPLPPSYVLRWTESQLETIKGRAGGTTFPEISKGAFRPLPVLVPSSGAVNAFERRAAPLMERVAANEVESKTLAATRDLLLPRLLSGELRVPDAERLVAEAV